MALISGVMGIKEHKLHFQTSSNQHTILAKLMFLSYIAMTTLAVPAILFVGILGFLGLWFAAEVFQVLAILRLNRHLFADYARLDFLPVYKLFALMGGATIVSAVLATSAGQKPLPVTALTTFLFIAVLLAISYPLFGLNEVWTYVRSRVAVTAGKST
jgi:hypothetical protein